VNFPPGLKRDENFEEFDEEFDEENDNN